VAHRGHRPTRMCVGCRRRFDDGSLVRFVLLNGSISPSSTSNGRGAWLCRESGCVDSALSRGTLRRALRAAQTATNDWSAEDLKFSSSSFGNASTVMKG